VYSFLKPLAKKSDGYIGHEVQLECTVSNSMAQVSWWQGDKKIEDGERFDVSKDLTGVCRLTIKKAQAADGGQITCRIEKQEDKTTTNLSIVGEQKIYAQ
jgi:hypothetical protein